MAHRLVPILSLVALVAACSQNSSRSTMEPGSANASVANGRGRGGRGGGDQALLRGITLSADQQQRVDSIRARYRGQMDQMRQGGGGGSGARTQMRTMMEQQQADIRAVLGPDQQAQFDRNVAEMRSRSDQGGGGRP